MFCNSPLKRSPLAACFVVLLLGVFCPRARAQYTPREVGEYVAAWSARLSSKDEKARLLACQSLSEMAEVLRYNGITALASRVRITASSDVQREAAKAIGNIGPCAHGAGIASIMKGLETRDDAVRGAMIDALGALAPYSDKALPVLMALTKDQNPMIREKSKSAIDRLRHPAKPRPAPAAMESKLILDADASPADARERVELWIGQLLTSSDANVQMRACQCLGQIGVQLRAAVPRLAHLLAGDASEQVRRGAATTLGQIGPPAWESCGAKLINALDDGDDRVRAVAIAAIGRMAPFSEAALPKLAEFIKDKNRGIRATSINALTSFGPRAKGAVPKLVEALNDPDPGVPGKVRSVRFWAMEALSEIGPDASDAAPALWELRKSADSETALGVLSCLAKLTPKNKALLAILIKNLGDKNTPVRMHASGTIGFLGPHGKDAIPALLQALKAEDDLKGGQLARQVRGAIIRTLQQIGPSAVPAVVEAFNYDSLNRSEKEQIIRGLGAMGPSALPFLRSLVESPVPSFRYYSTQAIKKIEGSR